MVSLIRRLVRLFDRTKPPGERMSGGLAAWSSVEASELVSWFGVHELERRPLPDGGWRLHLKPGGYQDSVDLWAELDAGDALRRARLVLARAWVDAPLTSPFALDLTKSALPVLAPGSAIVRQFAVRLEQQLGQMRVLMGAGALPDMPEPAAPEITAAVDTWLGRHERVGLADAAARLTLENRMEDGAPVLDLTVEPAA